MNGSINLVFNKDASGAALTGAGTNAATLAFGTVQAYGGTLTTGVTRTVDGTDFTPRQFAYRRSGKQGEFLQRQLHAEGAVEHRRCRQHLAGWRVHYHQRRANDGLIRGNLRSERAIHAGADDSVRHGIRHQYFQYRELHGNSKLKQGKRKKQ